MQGVRLAAAAVLVLLASCGNDHDREAVASAEPGTVVDREDAGDGLTRLRYASVDVRGEPSVVGALLAVPDGSPPEGGWPFIAYGHGTTGGADSCAPSDHPSLAGVGAVVQGFADAGYVAVATDYEGIGTPGAHPYLHGASEARTMVDAVRAARSAVGGVGDEYAVVGHSQGGHAALWAAQLADELAPDLRMVGAAAQAPAADPADLAQRFGPPIEALLAAGWFAAEPDVDPAEALTDDGRAAAELAEDACTFEARGPIVAPAARAAFDDYLASNVAGDDAVAPVLVAQGGRDQLVPPPVAQGVVERLCEAGATVHLLLYEDGDHLSVIERSAADVLAWLDDRFAGGDAPSDC